MTEVKYEQTRCIGNSQKKSNKTKTKAIKMFDFNTSKTKRYILLLDCKRLEWSILFSVIYSALSHGSIWTH